MDEKTKALLASSEERRRERVRALLKDRAVKTAVQRDQLYDRFKSATEQ